MQGVQWRDSGHAATHMTMNREGKRRGEKDNSERATKNVFGLPYTISFPVQHVVQGHCPVVSNFASHTHNGFTILLSIYPSILSTCSMQTKHIHTCMNLNQPNPICKSLVQHWACSTRGWTCVPGCTDTIGPATATQYAQTTSDQSTFILPPPHTRTHRQ